jgi:NTE family protein
VLTGDDGVGPPSTVTAFVLGGGGLLGSAEVGMLRALVERAITPDLVVGSSIGALNGLVVADDPSAVAVRRLAETWGELQSRSVFSASLFGQVTNAVRHGTHLHSNEALRALIGRAVTATNIEDLAVRFQCVAASIERAGAHWFDSGPVADAVLASCAVPGLLPPVRIGDEHFVDGGLIASVPVGRAVELGASRIFVLHVGRLEQPLVPPRRPWEVALVAFEIARRHQFVDDMARVGEIETHILPSGGGVRPISIRYRDLSAVARRIEAAYQATSAYLDALSS